MRDDTSNARALPNTLKEEITALKTERIISAAVDLFYEHGYENTTLDAVAERLGVTKPFIYTYFDSKTDLLAEICAHGIRELVSAIDSISPTAGSPTEKLRALSKKTATAILENTRHIAISTREEKNLEPAQLREINKMRRDFGHKLANLLQAGVKKGEFSIPDARITSLAIGGLASWTYVWYRPGGRFRIEEIADMLSDLILAMVQARPADGTPGGGRIGAKTTKAKPKPGVRAKRVAPKGSA